MRKHIYKIVVLSFVLNSVVNHSIAQFPLVYPASRTVLFDTVIHNKQLGDPYAWMSRQEHEKEMQSWARTQGIFTNSILDSVAGTEKLTGLLEKIYHPNPGEIIVKGTQGESVYYYKKMSDGKRWLVLQSNSHGAEEKILRLPIEINGRKYTAKKFAFDSRKKLLALMLVESGELNPHIRLLNLDTKTFLEDSIGPVMFNDASGVSMSWLPGDAGLLYTQAPANNNAEEKYYRGRIKLHLIGNRQEVDKPVFGFGVNKDIAIKEYETPYIYSFPHSPYIIARIRAGKGTNYAFAIHYSKLNGPDTRWIKLKDYRSNHGTFTANGPYLYAIDDAVPNMQVIKVNLKSGATPTVFLKETDKILAMSTGDPSITGGKNALYVKYTSPGKGGILKLNYSNARAIELAMPYEGTVGEFNLIGNNDLLFVTTNWINDYAYYTIKHTSNVVSAFNKGENAASKNARYVSEILYIPSRDGVTIPVSLVYHKDIKPGDKPRPLLMDAYGCFGSSMDPAYTPENFIWLEMGGIYAAAHIRGGGELGARWSAAGSYPTKMNSINDIVDIAAYFVKNNFTSGKQQAIIGASCGSLNVGLATLQRPDLFSAGVFIVGIPDLVTNKGNSFGRGQNDFGPLDTEEGFQSRLSISAYHHIIPDKSAPAMLVINGANDYIVPLHNAARYVAKLQNVQQANRPSLFMVDWKNGHTAAGTEEADLVRKWKFLLWQTGHEDFRPRQNKTLFK